MPLCHCQARRSLCGSRRYILISTPVPVCQSLSCLEDAGVESQSSRVQQPVPSAKSRLLWQTGLWEKLNARREQSRRKFRWQLARVHVIAPSLMGHVTFIDSAVFLRFKGSISFGPFEVVLKQLCDALCA